MQTCRGILTKAIPRKKNPTHTTKTKYKYSSKLAIISKYIFTIQNQVSALESKVLLIKIDIDPIYKLMQTPVESPTYLKQLDSFLILKIPATLTYHVQKEADIRDS